MIRLFSFAAFHAGTEAAKAGDTVREHADDLRRRARERAEQLVAEQREFEEELTRALERRGQGDD